MPGGGYSTCQEVGIFIVTNAHITHGVISTLVMHTRTMYGITVVIATRGVQLPTHCMATYGLRAAMEAIFHIMLNILQW